MKKLQKWLPGFLIFAVLLASLAGGAAYAKYVTQKQFDGSVTIKAELGTITLQEHTANRKEDGSYELLTSTTDKNEYIIIPGLDIPKDPFVTVTRTSPIPVYVFIEVVDTIESENKNVITYTADPANWLKVDGVTGKNGGMVYVYTTNGSAAAEVTDTVGPINILSNETVYVSQKLKQVTGGVSINFYASMGQVAAGHTPAEVYQSIT